MDIDPNIVERVVPVRRNGRTYRAFYIKALDPDPGRHCKGLDPALMFAPEAEDYESVSELRLATYAAHRYASELCQGCPMIEHCAEWGIAHEEYGVWGGLPPAMRKRTRMKRGQIFAPIAYETPQQRQHDTLEVGA